MTRIGKDSAGANEEWNNNAQGSIFTASTSFIIKTMAVLLISDAGHHVKFAIYDINGNLLWGDNQGQAVIVSPTGEWNWYQPADINFPVTTGQQLILVFKTDGCTQLYDYGWDQGRWLALNYEDPWPTTLPWEHGDTVNSVFASDETPPEPPEIELPPPPLPKTLPASTDPRFNHNPICLSDSWVELGDVPDMVRMKFAWVRLDFAWSDVESTIGVYEFNAKNLDQRVTALFEQGINVLGILAYGHPTHTGAWNKPAQTAEEIAAWIAYVQAVVNHFKDKIVAWEVYNEPNAGFFWQTGTPESSEQAAIEYMNLLRPTYDAIKNADPTAIVVAPSMWGLWCDPDDETGWMETLYKNGFKNYSDILSCHPYCGPFLPIHEWTGWFSPFDTPHLKDLVALMLKYGDAQKPIWLTEMGAALGDSYNSEEVVDEQRQSDIIRYAWYLSQWAEKGYSNIEKMFVHSWQPSDAYGIKGKIAEQTVLGMCATYNTAPQAPPIPPIAFISLLAVMGIGLIAMEGVK